MDERIGKVEETMGMIGGKWCPAIMFFLILDGTHRFSELLRGITGISQRMLTKQLRDLERAGLVHRTFHEAVPPRVEYTATALGLSLQPIYESVCNWSSAHRDEIETSRASYDRRA